MIKNEVNMSLKEVNKLEAIIRFNEGLITRKKAALITNFSERQVANKRKRYKKEGKGGLIHKGRGRPSPKKISNEPLNKILDLYDSKYTDFGPTLFEEMLKINHKIKISAETLRKYLIIT